MTSSKIFYWKIFRLTFVVFFLFLIRPVFSVWDGFRYYASLSEFFPSVALVTIFWLIMAVFTAVPAWLLLAVFTWTGRRAGREIEPELLILFMCLFLSMGAMAWAGKQLIRHKMPTPPSVKLAVLICVAIAAVYLTWLLRNRSGKLAGIIQERITPLVWLFGVWSVISIFLVTYHTWLKQPDAVQTQKISRSYMTDNNRPNIILVTYDALTARDMSFYGYHRPTTPFINKWAKTASLFANAQAGSNLTTPATASLMTGKRVWSHQTYHLRGSKPFKSNIESLPLMLKNNGYYNMAFIVNRYASIETLDIASGFDRSFPYTEFKRSSDLLDIIDALLYRAFGNRIRLYNWILGRKMILRSIIGRKDLSETAFPPEKAYNMFLSELDENHPGPFFAWIHVLPPHYPYLPHEPFTGMFDSSAEFRTLKGQWKLSSGEIHREERPDVDILRARYDEFIRYCDKQFEDFINHLADRNKLKKTVIILSSDHGESFTHDYLGHAGPHLYEELTHIPLIVREPGQSTGRIINDPVEQIDIPATILGLADIPVPLWMEGRSLVPLLRGNKLQPKQAFSMALEKNPSRGRRITKGTIAVREGDYKLIHYLEEEKSLLFNLKEDPDELRNIFDTNPEIGRRLLRLVKENLGKANERIGRGG